VIELPDKCPHEAFDGITGTCVPGFVYVAQVGEIHKIGFTAGKVNHRMNCLTYEQQLRITPKIVYKSHCALSLEKALHRVFIDKRILKRTDKTDYFNLSAEDLKALEQLTHYGGKELERTAAVSEEARRAAEPQIVYFLCPKKHEIRIDAGNPITRGFNRRLLLEVAARDGVLCPACKEIVIPRKYFLGELAD
jgi:hypothetical protein